MPYTVLFLKKDEKISERWRFRPSPSPPDPRIVTYTYC